MYLILTRAIADAVRAPLGAIAPVYQPIERAGGVFILPASVLSEQVHAAQWPTLLACPQMTTDNPAFPAPLEEAA